MALLMVGCSVPVAPYERGDAQLTEGRDAELSTASVPEIRLEVDPQRLVLLPRELPPGFSADLERTRPVTDISRDLGFLGGHHAAYERTGILGLFGAARIQSWALLFDSAGQAQSWFERGSLIRPRGEVSSIEIANVAHASKAIKLVELVKTATFAQTVEWTSYGISARVFNVVLIIVTTGISATADSGEALGYVRLLTTRIENAASAVAQTRPAMRSPTSEVDSPI